MSERSRKWAPLAQLKTVLKNRFRAVQAEVPDKDKPALDLVLEHKDNPVIAAALKERERRNDSTMASFNSWGGRLQDFIIMFSDKIEPITWESKSIKEQPGTVLWMAFMGLANDFQARKNIYDAESEIDENMAAALNVFLAPVAESLIEKIKDDEWGSLDESDVFRLHRQAYEAPKNIGWLSEGNKELFARLASEAVKSWMRARPWEKETGYSAPAEQAPAVQPAG